MTSQEELARIVLGRSNEVDDRRVLTCVEALLVDAGGMPLVIVVRGELADAVRQVYANVPCQRLDATVPESIDEVFRSLREDGST